MIKFLADGKTPRCASMLNDGRQCSETVAEVDSEQHSGIHRSFDVQPTPQHPLLSEMERRFESVLSDFGKSLNEYVLRAEYNALAARLTELEARLTKEINSGLTATVQGISDQFAAKLQGVKDFVNSKFGANVPAPVKEENKQ